MPANKAIAKKPTARKPSAKKPTPKKPTPKKPMTVRRGDLIVIDSPKVGSLPREGEVLQVIHGVVSVSYRVKWTDGNETLISPVLGSARFVRT